MLTNMVCASPSGIPVRLGNKPPMTNALRATLNKFLDQPIFHVNVDDIGPPLSRIPKKPESANHTHYGDGDRYTAMVERPFRYESRQLDRLELSHGSVEREAMGSQILPCDEKMFRSYGHRGRDQKYKDRNLLRQGSGLARAANAEF